MGAPFPRGLYAIVDLDSLTIRDPVALAAAALEGGAVAVQLRAKSAPGGDFLRVARQLEPLCAAHRAPFIINDRLDVAIAAGAQGVHLGQDDLDPADARRICAGTTVRWIGLSTHDLAQVRDAVDEGHADYLGFGPVLPTRSKARPDATVGVDGVEAAVRSCPLPIVAIGGIDQASARALAARGAHAVAVIGALAAAADPRAAAASFTEAFL